MTKAELDSLYETLRNDVSSLVDTTASLARVQKDENGKLYVAPSGPVLSNEQRVKRILGAICPPATDSGAFYSVLFYNHKTRSLPEDFQAIRDELDRQDRSCVTQNVDIRLVLLLLREEGVLEYGKTPLCGNADPTEFLKGMIKTSEIAYKDTMLAIIDDQRVSDKPIFIDNDPLESPGEKLDRAVLLLSLLSREEIYEYGLELVSIIEEQGIFSRMFSTPFDKIAPLFYLGSPKYKELFNNSKFKDGWASPEGKARSLADTLSAYTKAETDIVALDDIYYRTVLRQCLRAGVSVSGWLYRWDVAMKDSSINCHAWLLEHYNKEIIDMIVSNKGYYLIALDESSRDPLLHGKEYLPFRKHIVDNGYLGEVFQMYVADDEEFKPIYCSYIEIYPEGVSRDRMVRFFNSDAEYDEDGWPKGPSLNDILFGIAPNENNDYYRLISLDKIVQEDYSLDMDLYNATEYRKCGNPVKLREILTLLKGESKRVEPLKNTSIYDLKIHDDEYGYLVGLKSDSLENYKESLEPVTPDWMQDGDVILDTSSALVLKSSWPMQPTWVNVVSNWADEDHRKIVLAGDLSRDEIKAFSVDTKKANPWYVAYQISQRTRQFRLRSDENGRISDEQLLRMYIDLPSLEEQNAFVEKVIGDEIERKKKQVGAVDTLYNLSHTIGGPANKIQALLGNLIEMCRGDVEKTTMLKQVGDNFDYINRVIESTSQDYENLKVSLKEKRIIPLVERCVSSFSNLTFGIVPRLEVSDAGEGLTAKVNDTLFAVMVDNIMRNAYRHGFNKKISKDNKVLVTLDVVSRAEKNYLQMSICNNGNPLEDGFSIYDFVSRGKKGRATGNTGQGGYDIYQIVKKFDGFLGLRSTPDWNFIIDVLIPVSGTDPDKQYEKYKYGTLL